VDMKMESAENNLFHVRILLSRIMDERLMDVFKSRELIGKNTRLA
jgi:hypothetical protein